MLIQEFQANPEWSKENMQEVSRKTGLSEAQVYKWGWDQKKKMLDPTHDLHAELRMYKEHDEESEDKSIVKRLKFQSNQKSNKVSIEFQTPKEKFEKSGMKTRKSVLVQSRDDNKENEYSKNMSTSHETRGVKRKLKALNLASRDD